VATNISAATAIVIPTTSTPYSITLNARDTAQPYHEVWWAYHPRTCVSAMSIRAQAVSGTTYQPTVAVFTGIPATLTPYPIPGENNARDDDYTVETTTDLTYFIRVRSAFQNNDLDSDLSLTVTLIANETIAPIGSLAFTYISRRPLELRSASTGGVLQAIAGMPYARVAAALNAGQMCLQSTTGTSLEFFDAQFHHLVTLSYIPYQLTSSSAGDRFYVTNFLSGIPSGATIWAINGAGSLVGTWSPPIAPFVASGEMEWRGLAVSPNNALIYLGGPPDGWAEPDPAASGVIHVFDTVGGTVTDLGEPVLSASPRRYIIGGIVVLPSDGSLLVSYQHLEGESNHTHVYHYSSAGSVLHHYDLGAWNFRHLLRIPGDNTAFWIHLNSGGDVSTPDRVVKVRISDGAWLVDFLMHNTQLPLEYQGGSMWVTGAASPACVVTPPPTPLPPPPTPPPPVPGVPPGPCTPQTQTGNGGTGHAGCNTGGVGFVSLYNGPWGSVPSHADPIPGESMVNARGVDLWVEIVHTDFPTGDQTTYRRAMVDIADDPTYQGGLKSGGLLGVGDIEHGLGNEQGGFEAATVDIAYADSADRLFRNLLAGQELEGDEVRIKLATPAGRVAAVAPRVIARAVAQKPRLWSALNASFSASDYLFSEFGPFGPGRQFPSWLIPESIFPHATADSLKLSLPVLYGEKSDEGAVDPLTGVVNPKGLVPLIYVGPASLATTTTVVTFPPLDPSLVPPPDVEVQYLLHPAGELTFQAVPEHSTLDRYQANLFAAGTTDPLLGTLNLGLPQPDSNNTISYDAAAWLNSQALGDYDVTVTAIRGADTSESLASNAFSVPLSAETTGGGWGGPINTDPYFAVVASYNNRGSRVVRKSGVAGPYDPTGHDFRVTWTEAPQAAEYWVFMYTPGVWDAYANPQAAASVRYKRLSATPTNSRDPAWDYYVDWTGPTDGAVWPPAAGGTTTQTDTWDTYVVCGHAIFDILAVYGSDLGQGSAIAEQQRVRIDPGTRGDILCPFFPTWPFATPYRDFTAQDGSVYRMTVIYARGPLSQSHRDGVINMTINAIGIEDVGDGTGLPLTDAHAVQQHWIENFLINNYRSGTWVTDGTHPRWSDGIAMVRSSSFAALQTLERSRLGGRGLTVGWYAADQKVLQDWFREWNQSTDSRLGINADGQIVVAAIDETFDTTTWPHVRHEVDLFGDVVMTSGEERENVVSGVCDWDPDTRQFRGHTVVYESQRAITEYKGRRKEGNKIESTILVSELQLRWVLQRRLARLQSGTKVTEITGKIDLLDYDVGTGVLLTTIEGTGATGYVDKPFLILRRRFRVSDRLVTLTLLDLEPFIVPSENQFVIGDDTVSVATGNPIGNDGSPSTSIVVAN